MSGGGGGGGALGGGGGPQGGGAGGVFGGDGGNNQGGDGPQQHMSPTFNVDLGLGALAGTTISPRAPPLPPSRPEIPHGFTADEVAQLEPASSTKLQHARI